MAPGSPPRPRSSDVARRARDFQRASLAVRIPRWDRLRYWLAYMGLAHRGKPTYSATRDAVYEPGFFQRRYARALERINQRLVSSGPQSEPVEVPSFEPDELGPGDIELLTRLRIPFVLRGAARDLPVMDWTLESLEAGWGACTGPINQAADQPSRDLDRPTKAHHYYDFRMGTLAEVVDSVRTGGRLRFTVAEDVMHHNDGRLLEELDFPYWERMTGWAKNQSHWLRSRLFVGKVFSAQLLIQSGGAFSLWHTEPGDSYFVLSRGEKVWTLVHPLYSAAMRPRVKKTTNYTGSNIDLRESDEALRRRGFAGYLGVPKARVRLEPGDMLRVPNFWWHSVETLPGDYTLAASLRVEPGPNLLSPGLMAMRLLDRQAHAMMRAYSREGRISDSLIGQPRKSRSQGQPSS